MRGAIRTIARKELKSSFLSPIALIFLGVFLVGTLFIFFTYSKFFVRNLADVRPLFSWLPVLLIFLVSAVTMRQWSEEQKMGTLEILLTLPLRTRDLVLGKFLAGMALVALALVLTLPLPITVSMLGDLDWGPVIGGYVAALLVAGMYMAIGLCVSARTDNQIVALMVTALICSGLYFIGSDSVAGLVGADAGNILRGFGSGSRFLSIERGVLDLRDLAYYLSLTGFFLLLNVQFLEIKRMEKQPTDGATRRPVMLVAIALAALNTVALNLWLAPVTHARADLTADGEYSISDVTSGVLAGLNEPLEITGYFSEKTHPLLAPLVPRLKDFLNEYQVRGGGKVTVSFVEPTAEIEEEINEQYGIKSVPFRISGQNEEAVVNSYFHVLVRYGSEYEVLSFQDLIEVHADDNDVQVRLRNAEYDVTRAIKKVSQGFQSLESVLARNNQQVKLTAYFSATDKLPAEFKEVPDRLKKVADALGPKLGGRLSYEVVNPDGNAALQQEILARYRFQPMAVDPFSEDRFFMHMLLETGDHKEQVFPQGGLSEADLRTAIEAGIKRGTPGFLKTIGLMTEEVAMGPAQPWGQPPETRSDFRGLEQAMAEDFTVRRVKADDGVVPADIDVLLVAKPGNLTDKQQFAIDQYLMRGGSVIVLAGAYTISPERTGITAKKVDDKLLDLLQTYGVTVEDAFVMDPQNTSFPLPVREQRGPYVMERIELVPYPFFADIRQDGFNRSHTALAGVPSVALTWASPVRLGAALANRTAEVLLESSEGSWLRKSTLLEPDFKAFPESGFGLEEGATTGRQPLAVTVVGTFPSHFADKPSPLFGADVKDGKNVEADRTGRTLKSSTPDARLAVIGSSEFISDLVMQLGAQIGGGPYRGNRNLVRNLFDWALQDTDLLQIRSAGAFARTLRPLKPEEKTNRQLINYVIVLAALLGVLAIATTRRRMARPMELTPEEKR
ncbi:MAG: Gldg family protein [Myxococcales bacterium]|nr:Gldg family protein [Myxococcales bacterium]MCB9545427.1 Gldg family protein [Myxococcales bacterium]